MHTVLLIDDDIKLAVLLEQYFQRFNLKLISKAEAKPGIKQALNNDEISLVILDVMLPDIDGFEVCKIIRKTSQIPIIMLTARGDVMDRVVGLEIGANDYLPKPFEPRELVARIINIIKLSENNITSDSDELSFVDLVITQNQVKLKNKEINLTNKELNLLLLLAKNPNHVFSRDDIMNQLSGIDADYFSRSIDILISRLRNKLKPLDYIKTIHGSGYKFTPVDL